jgi:hypothetical protein
VKSAASRLRRQFPAAADGRSRGRPPSAPLIARTDRTSPLAANTDALTAIRSSRDSHLGQLEASRTGLSGAGVIAAVIRPEKESPFGRDVAGGVSCATAGGGREMRRRPNTRPGVESLPTQRLQRSDQEWPQHATRKRPSAHFSIQFLIATAIIPLIPVKFVHNKAGHVARVSQLLMGSVWWQIPLGRESGLGRRWFSCVSGSIVRNVAGRF